MTASRAAILVVALAGAVLGVYYFLAIDSRDLDYSQQLQTGIVDGVAFSPYRYRILSPLLIEPLARAFSLAPALAIFDIAAYTFQLLAMYVLLRRWFAPARAVAGCVFVASVAHVTFAYFRYHPWSILEVGLLALGLAAADAGRYRLLGLLTMLAALNRETGVFLPLACLLGALWMLRPLDVRTTPRDRRLWLLAAYVLVSVAIFGALRLLRGSAPQVDLLSEVLQRNIMPGNVERAAWGILLMFGAGWPLAVLGLRRAPPFLCGASLIAIPYLVVFLIWGTWREMRLLTTLYPVLAPLVLFALNPAPAATSDPRRPPQSGHRVRCR